MTSTPLKYLTVPPLYEEGDATITWENNPGAEQYELDMVFDSDFDGAGHGKTWADLAISGWQWECQDSAAALAWQDIPNLPAQGLMWRNLEFLNRSCEAWDADPSSTWRWLQEQPVTFTAYNGPGVEVAAPDQGRTWADINSADRRWHRQDTDSGVTWRDMELLPAIGLMWWQHDQNGYAYEDLERAYDDWHAFEHVSPRGLAWKSLDARWKSWKERQLPGDSGGGLSWWDLDHLPPDNRTHKGARVSIPLYTKSSMLRARALDAQNNATDYITTGMIRHRPRSLAKYRPPCIHLPDKIYEEGKAEISWGDLYGAQGFVLERKVNNGAYTVVFRGQGHPVSLPCADLDRMWDVGTHYSRTVDIPLYTKKVSFRVKAFNTTDESRYTTSAAVKTLPRSLAKYSPPCIHVPDLYEGDPAEVAWGDLYGAQDFVLERSVNGAAYTRVFRGPGASSGLSCPAVDAIPDVDAHFSHTDTVPIGAQEVVYRVFALNTTDSSQSKTASIRAVTPVFYRSDSTSFSILKEHTYYIEVFAEGITGFRDIVLTAAYDPNQLTLTSFGPHLPTLDGAAIQPGAQPVELLPRQEGKVRFRCRRAIPAGSAWSGLVTRMAFRAKAGGRTTVTLM